jgi:hypothetical protein
MSAQRDPFAGVMRMRRILAAGLLAPLAFFIFLVVRFEEAWILAVAGVLVYLYILAQFFVFQNPARRLRNAEADAESAGTGNLSPGEDL